MAKNKNNHIGGVQVGGSSLIMVFTVLTLATFATLSLASASADLRLTEKAETTVQSYYEADGLAEEKRQEIEKNLQSIYEKSQSKEEYYRNAGKLLEGFQNGSITYSFPLINGAELFVELFADYPAKGEELTSIIQWKRQIVEDIEIDDSVDVWTGEEE